MNTWGSSERDRGVGVALDSSGNIYVVGDTDGFGAGDRDILLLKYDHSGSLLWQRTWGGSSYDWSPRSGVALGSSGNVYIVGSTGSFGAGDADVLLLKYDPSGDLLWQRTWGGSELDYGLGMALDSLDNVYVTGLTESTGGEDDDLILLKFDPSGELLWQRTWGESGKEDCGFSITFDSLGHVYVVGITDSAGSMGQKGFVGGQPDISKDALLLKFDSSGDLLWQRTWGQFGEVEWGTYLAVDSSDNIYATGWASNPRPRQEDLFLLKLDTSGNLLWQRTWGGRGTQQGFGATADASGKIYVSGITFISGPDGPGDVFLLEIDSSGSMVWQSTWGSSGVDGPHSSRIALDSSGALFVTGEVRAPPYTLGTPIFALSTPDFSLGESSIPVDIPSFKVGTPEGIVGTPEGSESYAGERDLFLLKYMPP